MHRLLSYLCLALWLTAFLPPTCASKDCHSTPQFKRRRLNGEIVHYAPQYYAGYNPYHKRMQGALMNDNEKLVFQLTTPSLAKDIVGFETCLSINAASIQFLRSMRGTVEFEKIRPIFYNPVFMARVIHIYSGITAKSVDSYVRFLADNSANIVAGLEHVHAAFYMDIATAVVLLYQKGYNSAATMYLEHSVCTRGVSGAVKIASTAIKIGLPTRHLFETGVYKQFGSTHVLLTLAKCLVYAVQNNLDTVTEVVDNLVALAILKTSAFPSKANNQLQFSVAELTAYHLAKTKHVYLAAIIAALTPGFDKTLALWPEVVKPRTMGKLMTVVTLVGQSADVLPHLHFNPAQFLAEKTGANVSQLDAWPEYEPFSGDLNTWPHYNDGMQFLTTNDLN